MKTLNFTPAYNVNNKSTGTPMLIAKATDNVVFQIEFDDEPGLGHFIQAYTDKGHPLQGVNKGLILRLENATMPQAIVEANVIYNDQELMDLYDLDAKNVNQNHVDDKGPKVLIVVVDDEQFDYPHDVTYATAFDSLDEQYRPDWTALKDHTTILGLIIKDHWIEEGRSNSFAVILETDKGDIRMTLSEMSLDGVRATVLAEAGYVDQMIEMMEYLKGQIETDLSNRN